MKKFLFTLAALLMASSAFATVEKFTMEGRELAKTELGTEIAFPVTAEFEAMVSGFDLEFVCPEGVSVTGHSWKAGRKINCLMYSEDEEDYVMTSFTPAFKRLDNKIVAITSTLEEEYDYINDELVSCGAVKWKPGTHYMLDIKLTFAADFQGGTVQLVTKPTCGNDPRAAAGMYPRSTGDTQTVDVVFTVEQDTPPTPEQAVEPTITPSGDYAQTITIAGEEGANLFYSLDGVNYQAYTEPFILDVPGEYTVYAYAVGPGDKTQSEIAELPVIVTEEPAGQANKPEITITNNNTTSVGITITAEAGAEIYYQITANGAKAYSLYTESFTYGTPGTYTIEAYAVGPNGKTESVHETAEFTVKAPAQPSTPGDIQVTEITPTGYYVMPTGNNAQIIVNGEPVDAPYFVARPEFGQEDANVVIYVRTDDDAEGDAYYPVITEVTLPVKAQLPTPEINYESGKASIDWIPGQGYDYENATDGHYVTVTITGEPGYEIHYVINNSDKPIKMVSTLAPFQEVDKVEVKDYTY